MSNKNWGNYQYKGEVPVKEIKPKAKKNTKRWCKGKVGREHVLAPEVITFYGVARPCALAPAWWRKADWWCHHWMVCSACGKHVSKVPEDECPSRILVDKEA